MRYLLYDDNCPFCSKIADRISKLINIENFQIIPIESKSGEELIKNNSLENINSIIYINEKGKIYLKSKAVIQICYSMRFPYKIAYILNILPNVTLDFFYDLIAQNRMKIKI